MAPDWTVAAVVIAVANFVYKNNLKSWKPIWTGSQLWEIVFHIWRYRFDHGKDNTVIESGDGHGNINNKQHEKRTSVYKLERRPYIIVYRLELFIDWNIVRTSVCIDYRLERRPYVCPLSL